MYKRPWTSLARPSLLLLSRLRFRHMSHSSARLEKWEKEHQRQFNIASQEARVPPPTVSFVMGGDQAAFTCEASTPLQAMAQYSKTTGLKLPSVVAASVTSDNKRIVWDLSRPFHSGNFTDPCVLLQVHSFDDDGMAALFWHSSAHILGAALEAKFGDDVLLCDGPSGPDGFFYEMHLAHNQTLSEHDFHDIEEHMRRLIKAKVPFERMEVTRDVARDMFSYSTFKCAMVDKIPDHEPVTVYRCGDFVDLCRGPHLPHTGTNT
jgi:threonyl-tRNA synthetase